MNYQQMKKKTGMFDEIGHLFGPGALNDTKTMRTASGDMFANVGAEQP